MGLSRTTRAARLVFARQVRLSRAACLMRRSSLPGYAELHCLSSFSFLRGASQPAELAERAQALGYAALAITDECSVAGVVRAHTALAATLKSSASSSGDATRLIVGAEFRLACGTPLVVLARDRRGYADLCRLITRARRAAPKGSYHLTRDDCVALLAPAHVFVLWTPRPADRTDDVAARATADWLRTHFAAAAWIAVELLRDGTERAHLAALTKLARDSELPLVAAGAVCMQIGRAHV